MSYIIRASTYCPWLIVAALFWPPGYYSANPDGWSIPFRKLTCSGPKRSVPRNTTKEPEEPKDSQPRWQVPQHVSPDKQKPGSDAPLQLSGKVYLLNSNRRAGKREPRHSWQEEPLKANREKLLDFQPRWSSADGISAANSLSCFNSSNSEACFKEEKPPDKTTKRHKMELSTLAVHHVMLFLILKYFYACIYTCILCANITLHRSACVFNH